MLGRAAIKTKRSVPLRVRPIGGQLPAMRQRQSR